MERLGYHIAALPGCRVFIPSDIRESTNRIGVCDETSGIAESQEHIFASGCCVLGVLQPAGIILALRQPRPASDRRAHLCLRAAFVYYSVAFWGASHAKVLIAYVCV